MDQMTTFNCQTFRDEVVFYRGINLYDIATFPSDIQVMDFVTIRNIVTPGYELEQVWSILKSASELSCVDSKFQLHFNFTNFYCWIILHGRFYTIIPRNKNDLFENNDNYSNVVNITVPKWVEDFSFCLTQSMILILIFSDKSYKWTRRTNQFVRHAQVNVQKSWNHVSW